MSLSELLIDYVEQQKKGMQTGMVCRMVLFNSSTLRADVQPLYFSKNGVKRKNYPILPKIAVLFTKLGSNLYIKPFYKTGDLVLVSFSTFEIDGPLKNSMTLESERSWSMENACVIGHVAPKVFKAPDNSIYVDPVTGNLVFEFKTGPTVVEKIQMGTAGIKTKKNIESDLDVVALAAVPAVSVKLSTHQHPTAAPGAPSSPIPGT